MQNDPFSKLGALDQKLYQKQSPSITEQQQVSPTSKQPEEKKTKERMDASTNANVHARTHTRIDALLETAQVETLYRKLQHKHHLSSYTFRFRHEELEELSKLDTKLEKTHPNKLSKNDLVRLGVNWLLEDYEKNGDISILARILARI